jgi:transposase
MTNNHRITVANRRSIVWDYICEGMQISDIAPKLGVEKSTISKDIKFLVRDSQKYLNDMAKQTLSLMCRQSIEGMQQILTECWSRHGRDGNMLALKIALDCHKEIFNQAANGVSVLAVKKITDKANAVGIG